MKKSSKLIKIIACLVILTLTMSFVASASEFTFEDDGSRILVSNEYLEYAIRDCLYTMGTTAGNPLLNTDDNKLLLFGHDDPGTSYATLVVDGKVYSPANGYYDSFVDAIHNKYYDSTTGSYVVEYIFDSIAMKQIFTIVDNNSTGRKDVVEFKYVVTNNDTATHNIGFRIMLDTMLADNDYAPFRVPGTGDVITETEYEGSAIPQYWQAFDDLENPSTIAQGTFFRAGYRAPDKVQFVSWPGVTDIPWNYEITPGMYNGDSAVTVIWNEKAIAAGQSETYVTYYGLSELQQVSKELSLSLYTDATIDVINGKYNPNPTVATAYVKNISNYTVDNVVINLSATSPLSIDSATPAEISIGSLAPGEEKQISWNLDIAAVSEETIATVTAVLTGTDVETLEVSRNMTIPALEAAEEDKPIEDDKTDDKEEEEELNFFQKIWAFFMKIFVFLGLS